MSPFDGIQYNTHFEPRFKEKGNLGSHLQRHWELGDTGDNQKQLYRN